MVLDDNAHADFFKEDGSKRFLRHPLNNRKQLQVRASYKRGILKDGLYDKVGQTCQGCHPGLGPFDLGPPAPFPTRLSPASGCVIRAEADA